MLPVHVKSIFFSFIVITFKLWFFNVETESILHIQHYVLRIMCPFIAYRVTELETVFCGLIFWRFLLIPPN